MMLIPSAIRLECLARWEAYYTRSQNGLEKPLVTCCDWFLKHFIDKIGCIKSYLGTTLGTFLLICCYSSVASGKVFVEVSSVA